MDRLATLQDIQVSLTKYTKTDPWRPALLDLWVYDVLIGMYDSDYEDPTSQYWLWRKTPDEVMQHIINSSRIFDLEYGWEQLDEEIREYLVQEEFIVDVDEASDEEYQNNMEGK